VARDLIPPPSPAGRPSPDPEPWSETAQADRDAHAAEAAATPPARGPSPFRTRFGFVLGALLGIAVAAAVAFFVVIGTSSRHHGVQLADHWSSWYPPSDDVVSGAAAIANHVQTSYKRDDGKQLVSVHGGPLFVVNNGTPIPFGIKLLPSDGTILDLGSNGVFYTLTGTGKAGRITGEKASPARHRLLRREALELALYSFRYVHNINLFVALLPLTDPKVSAKAVKGKAAKAMAAAAPQLQAVFFRPGDLRHELQEPLSATLDPMKTMRPKALGPAESKRIDRLTKDNLFLARFQPQPDGQLYLLLDRSGDSG
jgi:hypothetical protein